MSKIDLLKELIEEVKKQEAMAVHAFRRRDCYCLEGLMVLILQRHGVDIQWGDAEERWNEDVRAFLPTGVYTSVLFKGEEVCGWLPKGLSARFGFRYGVAPKINDRQCAGHKDCLLEVLMARLRDLERRLHANPNG